MAEAGLDIKAATGNLRAPNRVRSQLLGEPVQPVTGDHIGDETGIADHVVHGALCQELPYRSPVDDECHAANPDSHQRGGLRAAEPS
jgi:hypothetical protein